MYFVIRFRIFFTSSSLSKNVKIKIYRTITLPVLLYKCKSWSLSHGGRYAGWQCSRTGRWKIYFSWERWVRQNRTVLVSYLLGWQHVSATVDHHQVTKIYEEKIYSIRTLVVVYILRFQRDLVVLWLSILILIIQGEYKLSEEFAKPYFHKYWKEIHDNWRMKDQIDVTCYFISLLMCSTCFGH